MLRLNGQSLADHVKRSFPPELLGITLGWSTISRKQMPTVLRIGPYRFFFVPLDRGEPPHIHVRREGMVAKFWLDPVVLQRAGGFNRAELSTIAKLIQEHRETFLEGWYGFFGH